MVQAVNGEEQRAAEHTEGMLQDGGEGRSPRYNSAVLQESTWWYLMTYKVCVPIYQVSLSELTVTVTNAQCPSASVLLSVLSTEARTMAQGGVRTNILLTSKDKNLQYRSQENWIWDQELSALDLS